MISRSGILLCGGRSSRMGRPKAWLPWGNHPMVAHVVEILGSCVDEVVVVASESLDLPPLDARVVRDREPDLGPLAGIAVGLGACRGTRAFVTATDAPFLTPRFIEAMFERCGPGGAAAPSTRGIVQPLAAVYPARGAARAQRLVREGRRRPLELLKALDFRAVPLDELPDPDALRGFNTPAEYLEAVAEAFGPATATLELLGRARRQFGQPALEVPVGSLASVLGCVAPDLAVCEGGRVHPAYLVSLGGRDFVRDARIPIGPGERVVVFDASVGG